MAEPDPSDLPIDLLSSKPAQPEEVGVLAELHRGDPPKEVTAPHSVSQPEIARLSPDLEAAMAVIEEEIGNIPPLIGGVPTQQIKVMTAAPAVQLRNQLAMLEMMKKSQA